MKTMKKVLAAVLLVCMMASMMSVSAAADMVSTKEITLNRYGLPLGIGEVYDLTASVNSEIVPNPNLVWSSNNETVATVDANGVVSAVAAGSAQVTAATVDGLYSVVCDVLVAETLVNAQGISLDKTELSMDMGASTTLIPTLYPEETSLSSVVWKSSDETVVTVDENGNVYALAAGSAVVSAWAAELDLSAVPMNEALMAKCQIYVVDRAAEEAARIAAEQAAAEEAARLAAEEEAARIAAEQAAAEEAARLAAEEEAARIAAEQAAAEEAARLAAEEEAARIAAEQAAAEEAARLAAEEEARKAAEQAAAEEEAKKALEDTLVLPTVGVNANSAVFLSGPASISVSPYGTGLDLSTLEIGDAYTLSATTDPYDPSLPGYTWESSNSNVVSVSVPGDSANCVVTVVGAGSATIKVSRGESVTPYEIPVTVHADAVTITDSKSAMLTGESYSFAAEGKWGSKAVSWISGNNAVVTVDANGLVHAVGAGEAVITAVAASDRANPPASASVTVTVSDPIIPVTGVSLDKSGLELAPGGSYDLTATVAPENASNKNVTWVSGDTSIASVNENGVVTAVAAGSTTVTAYTVDGSFNASCAVTVSVPTVAVSGVTLDKNTLALSTGGSGTLTATVTPAEASNKTVSWTSSDSSVATVADGVVTAVKAGSATITVITADGSKSATCAVTVTDPAPAVISVTGVSLDRTAMELSMGSVEGFMLKATVAPENASDKRISWSSSDPSVAIVDASGNVKALKAGITVITVTTVDGSKSASCTVTVKAKPAVDIQCAYEAPAFLTTEGKFTGISAIIRDNALAASNFVWSSSDESVVTVKGTGANNATCEVTIKGKVGSAVITASHAGCDADSIAVNVVAPTNVAVTGISITGSSSSTTVGGTLQLGSVVTPENASNKAMTWSSNNTAIATVDQTGKVTGVGVGTVHITATAQDGSGKSATVAITVAAAPTGVLYVTSNINTLSSAGGTALLTARLSNNSVVPNASVTWTVSPADMATVSVNGVVTPKRVGSFTVTGNFSAGGVNYTGSTSFRVNPVMLYGNNSTYNGGNTPLYFVANDLSGNVRSVRVDGYPLTHGQHCYIYDHQGYIAVALNPAYLKSLSPSVVHTIQIDSANGTTTGYFRIYGYSSSIYGVQTGDENQAGLWAALLFVSMMGMGAVLVSRRKEWQS